MFHQGFGYRYRPNARLSNFREDHIERVLNEGAGRQILDERLP
jgi:hypothetical protein